MTLQPGTRLGSYEVVEKIGAGGMGAVYKGYQSALGRYVAIKVLPPQTAGDPAFAERFAQEARAIGKLRHPNIVTAFDFAHDGDVAFLVSEFVDGGTLADQLGAPLPLDYTIQLLAPIAAALDYAHARGIVHRDIKPQNILMTHDGMPVLTDFGLAKIVGPGSGMTQAGSLMGTAEYIAPECASGAEVAGPPADQYALGLVAYQMLVGRHPFPADNPLSALMAHVHKPVPLPSTLGVTLAPGVEAALLKVLAKRPEERYARSGDFVRALGGSLFNAPAALAAASATPVSEPPAPLPPARASEPAISPLLSPSALVRPPESTPPPAATPVPQAVTPAGAAAGTTTMFPAGGPSIAAAPLEHAPWWRTRRVLVVPGALLLALLILSQLGPRGRTGGAAQATAAQTAPVAVADDHGNSGPGATTIASLPATINGTLAPAGDIDVFRFTARAGQTVQIELRLGTLGEATVGLVASGGNELASDSVSGDKVARITHQLREAGVYFVNVRGARGSTGTYQLGLSAR
ncbi:MAG TPA: protein kinase [Candidatus Limnocylindria bacterium]|nr:protein kinase [Candidatus Limnocylindria bacterium]